MTASGATQGMSKGQGRWMCRVAMPVALLVLLVPSFSFLADAIRVAVPPSLMEDTKKYVSQDPYPWQYFLQEGKVYDLHRYVREPDDVTVLAMLNESISQFQDNTLLVYFYSDANTAVCKKEVCGPHDHVLRDRLARHYAGKVLFVRITISTHLGMTHGIQLNKTQFAMNHGQLHNVGTPQFEAQYNQAAQGQDRSYPIYFVTFRGAPVELFFAQGAGSMKKEQYSYFLVSPTITDVDTEIRNAVRFVQHNHTSFTSLQRFYKTHDPSKADEDRILGLMRKYSANPSRLMTLLETKYKARPQTLHEETTRPALDEL